MSISIYMEACAAKTNQVSIKLIKTHESKILKYMAMHGGHTTIPGCVNWMYHRMDNTIIRYEQF